MSKTLAVSTNVSLSGDGWGGAPLFSETLQNTAGGLPTTANLVSGNNTVAVPATALGVLIVPPPTNALALTLKGAAGDTGIAIDSNASTRLMFNAAGAVASFVLNAGGTVAVELVWL